MSFNQMTPSVSPGSSSRTASFEARDPSPVSPTPVEYKGIPRPEGPDDMRGMVLYLNALLRVKSVEADTWKKVNEEYSMAIGELTKKVQEVSSIALMYQRQGVELAHTAQLAVQQLGPQDLENVRLKERLEAVEAENTRLKERVARAEAGEKTAKTQLRNLLTSTLSSSPSNAWDTWGDEVWDLGPGPLAVPEVPMEPAPSGYSLQDPPSMET